LFEPGERQPHALRVVAHFQGVGPGRQQWIRRADDGGRLGGVHDLAGTGAPGGNDGGRDQGGKQRRAWGKTLHVALYNAAAVNLPQRRSDFV
jgi:hypothetical protein